KVACWNSPNGCNFAGPAFSLLEHYKDCAFHVVSCPRCHSAVPRSEIVGHCKDGCSVLAAGLGPNTDHIEKKSNELKEALGKLSEEMSCLHTSLNHCREDVRSADERFKEQLEAHTATLSEYFSRFSTACSYAIESRLIEVALDVSNAVKGHLAEELRAQKEHFLNATGSACRKVLSFTGQSGFHWYAEGWAARKVKALEGGQMVGESPAEYVCGYKVSCCIGIRKYEELEQSRILLALRLHCGEFDS
ncbi:unnamed protein product, partial [Ixodes hexagonus]